jgi:PAS domain S-box-containing protein/putative nucleotidyltransferase with HDIG domain
MQGDEPGYRGMVQRIAKPMVPEYEHISGTEALEKILEAVLIIGPDLKIVYANRNFYELFGYEPEDVLGAPLGTLGVDRRETISSSEEVIAAIHARGFWQGEVRRRAKPGNYIPVLLNARPFTDSHGSFKGYIGTYQDLRETHSTGMKNRRALLSVVQAVSCAIEHRTPDRLSHQKRVAELCVDIGLELGLDHKRLEGLRLGALLHDIGKLYLPTEIVARRGPLNEFEAGLINSHPRLGSDIVKGLELPWPLEDMILQHHEKLDGSGYPNHLKGDEIIQEARIIAVVDALDELHHHAANADGKRAGPSLGQLEEKKGEWYDSEIVEVCMRLLKTGRYPDYTRLISPG